MAEATIRPIDAHAPEEIQCVASRMRDALSEVEGAERGAALYTLEWLEERVRWHLAHPRACVLVAVDSEQQIVGHTIVRAEQDNDGPPYGLISTTYVLPAARRAGLAQRFLHLAEVWFRAETLASCCTWTSASNAPLIALYTRNGYAQWDAGPNDLNGTPMIKLGKLL
ncbi:hypothetical protein SE17_07510 [Kouleothrix aurantiaca]|uniref:N-acetyltransferase domain-containing protein n=1 Tax=Kouleothrix aurantiaca TaxID=186479 RepID=A0A0N8PSV7_9CHLR|nr:hypothetical protein SE17_07510 [Kouleothrix aurantiaca]